MRIPSMRLYGKENVQIISHKGLGKCTENCIEVFSNAGTICVCGEKLEISIIREEYISVRGKIKSIFYK